METESVFKNSGESKDTTGILIPKIDPENKVDSKSSDADIPKKRIKSKKRKVLTIVGIISLIFLISISVVGFLGYKIYKKGLDVKSSVDNLAASFETQDLVKIKSELQNTKKSTSEFKTTYKSILWIKPAPFVGRYIADGEHAINAAVYAIEASEIIIETIEPYADIIGFANDSQDAQSPDETTQDRIDFVIKTIPDVIPKANIIAEKVNAIQIEIDKIDPARYPEKFADYEVRAQIKKGREAIDLAAGLVSSAKPLLESAPYIFGTEEARTYLILFQNDKELRPTGGFITAYSIAKVETGKFEPVSSNDIYNLDILYFPTTPAPAPIIDYIRGPYVISKNLRLRDINWSPDFSVSMKLFVEEVKKVGITDIDGIIAVDTQLLVNLLEVLGPIGVPGFGEFSTEIVAECNCPQVIYELESFADVEGPVVWSQDEPGKIIFAPPNIDNRKKIIGPLMNSILSNALGQPKDKLPELFAAGFKSLLEKHVLFYLLEPGPQAAVVEFGIGGSMDREYAQDYLHINDANLGGRKSNLYVTQEVNQEIEIDSEGNVEKIVTITYKNPEKFDGWLNSVLPNWVRIYVPKGSELISFDGVEDIEDPYEEFNKTVFAGYFELRPEGLAKVALRYKLPFKATENEYLLYVQKQPGTDAPLYTISIGKQASGPVGPTARREEELFLRTDKEFKFKL